MSLYVDPFVDLTPAQKSAESEGGQLNVAAFQARNKGDLQEAECLYLLAIALSFANDSRAFHVVLEQKVNQLV